MLLYGSIVKKVISKPTRQRCGCITNVIIIFVFREAFSKRTYKFINYIVLVSVYFSGVGVILNDKV